MKNIVVAYDKQRGIGKDNELLWDYRDIPRDMEQFRLLTIGHTVVMGRRTFESIGKRLPHRRNIVISRKALEIAGVEVVPSLEAAYAAVPAHEDIYIIGGGQVYSESITQADRIYATEIDENFSSPDTFFPVVDTNWRETSREHFSRDEQNKYDMDFVTYERTTR